MIVNCPLCYHEHYDAIMHIPDAPLFQLIDAHEKIDSSHFGVLDIVMCKACGHVFNRSFTDHISPHLYDTYVFNNVPIDCSISNKLESMFSEVKRKLKK